MIDLRPRSSMVIERARRAGVGFHLLPSSSAEPIRDSVASAFTVPEFARWKQYQWTWLWSGLAPGAYASVYETDPYSDLDDFLISRPYVMFFNYDEDKAVILFPSDTAISRLTQPDEIDEFYVTSESADFLLCYNHEQVLLGCGDAMTWMKTYYFAENE